MIDLFEDYENIPSSVNAVFVKHTDEECNLDGLSYEKLTEIVNDIETLGYTFDFYLDAMPYGLRPVGTPITEVEGFEEI